MSNEPSADPIDVDALFDQVVEQLNDEIMRINREITELETLKIRRIAQRNLLTAATDPDDPDLVDAGVVDEPEPTPPPKKKAAAKKKKAAAKKAAEPPAEKPKRRDNRPRKIEANAAGEYECPDPKCDLTFTTPQGASMHHTRTHKGLGGNPAQQALRERRSSRGDFTPIEKPEPPIADDDLALRCQEDGCTFACQADKVMTFRRHIRMEHNREMWEIEKMPAKAD